MFEILVFGRISLKRFPSKTFFAISMRVLAGPILHWKINLDLIIILQMIDGTFLGRINILNSNLFERCPNHRDIPKIHQDVFEE